MNWADLINGGFELFGAFALWQNVIAVRRDRKVLGYNPKATIFFTTWGIWNLYFYPSLGQWLSFWGGVAIVTVNAIWLGHVFYYMKLEGRHGTQSV